MRQIHRVWAGRPKLRSLYRAQIRRMKSAMGGHTASCAGFKPNSIATYYPDTLLPYYSKPAHCAWSVGYHAGRAFRLKELAYDARPEWAIPGWQYLKPHYHVRAVAK
jgi:hypothetical protein